MNQIGHSLKEEIEIWDWSWNHYFAGSGTVSVEIPVIYGVSYIEYLNTINQ